MTIVTQIHVLTIRLCAVIMVLVQMHVNDTHQLKVNVDQGMFLYLYLSIMPHRLNWPYLGCLSVWMDGLMDWWIDGWVDMG